MLNKYESSSFIDFFGEKVLVHDAFWVFIFMGTEVGFKFFWLQIVCAVCDTEQQVLLSSAATLVYPLSVSGYGLFGHFGGG